MARILRVEMKLSMITPGKLTNIGPYQYDLHRKISYWLGLEMFSGSTSIDYQPEPCDDGFTDHFNGYHYGFKDAAQFYCWYMDDIAQLEWAGFVLSEYEVPDDYIQYGQRQLCFILSRATLVAMYEPREYVWNNNDFITDNMGEYLIDRKKRSGSY